MLYRKLPNNDEQRLLALRTARKKGDVKQIEQRAFSSRNWMLLNVLLPMFSNHSSNRSEKSVSTSEFGYAKLKVQNLITDFIEDLNQRVEQEALPLSQRVVYQWLQLEQMPSLGSASSIVNWGVRIIAGELQQANDVKELENALGDFLNKSHLQPNKRGFDKEPEGLRALRNAVDELIADIWDEVEVHYSHVSPKERRNKVSEYGVIYGELSLDKEELFQ